MSTSIGDLKLSILLDVAPFSESVKTALNLLKMFSSSANDIMKLRPPTFDSADFDAEIHKLNNSLERYQKEIKDTINEDNKLSAAQRSVGEGADILSGSLERAFLRVQGFQSVLVALKSTFGDLLVEYQKQEVANDKLLNNLKNVGEGVDAFRKLTSQASDYQKITVYADEQIIDAQAMLGTFKKTSEEIGILTPRILDLAAAFDSSGEGGKSLTEIAVMLGKVNEETIGTLRRVGVAFTKEEEEKLKSLQGTEQAIYLSQILDTNFKGLAQTVGSTSAGQMQIFKNSVGEVKESLGQFLAEALGPVVKGASSFIAGTGAMADSAKVATLGIIAMAGAFVVLNTSMGGIPYIILGVATAGTALWTALHRAPILVEDFKKAIDENANSMSEFSGKIDTLKSNIKDLESVYERLSSQTALSETEQKNYEAVLGRLTAIYPQILSSIDEHTGRLTANKEAVLRLIEAEKQRLSITQNARSAEQFKYLDDLISKYSDVSDSMSDLIAEQKQLESDIANGGVWRSGSFGGTQYKVSVDKLKEELDDVNKKLFQTQEAGDAVSKAIYDAIEQGIKFGNVEQVIDRVKLSVKGSELATKSFFSVMSSFTGQALNDWSQIASAIASVKNLMNSTAGEILPQRPTKSIIDSKISELNQKIDNEPDVKKIREYQKSIEELQTQRDKLLGVDNKTIGRSRTGSHVIKEEKDQVDELIKSWEKAVDIFYTASEFQSKFTTEGKSVVDVYKLINEELKSNSSLSDDQILKLVAYRDKLLDLMKDSGVSFKNLIAGGITDEDPQELVKRFVKERMDWYNEYGSKDRRFKPLNEATEYAEAVKLIKEIKGETLTLLELQSLSNLLKEKANSLDDSTEANARIKLNILKDSKSLEEEILKIRKKAEDALFNSARSSIELMENEFRRRRALLDLEHKQKMQNLDEQIEKARSQTEINALIAQKNALRSARQIQKEQIDLDEMNDFAVRLDDMWSGGIRNAQTIARMFGQAGANLAASFDRALMLAQAIKAVFDTIALVKGFISLFSFGSGAALPAFHSGGILPGHGDIPILAQGGEGIIRRDRMIQLSQTFGAGFFDWLNGSSSASRLGVYHNGGVVSSAARFNMQVREVPYVASTDVSGTDLKLILTRQNKIDSRRSKS